MIVHHQAIIVADVDMDPAEVQCSVLQEFLRDLVRSIGMQQLTEPIAVRGTYGFTGLIGIVTSHIAFHFFEDGRALHLDVYSCKRFDLDKLMRFIDGFWRVKRADVLFLQRDKGPSVERYSYSAQDLVRC